MSGVAVVGGWTRILRCSTMSGTSINVDSLDSAERRVLDALVASAEGGNATAAAHALLAVQRIREKNSATLHRSRMADLAHDGEQLAEYLGTLGLTLSEVETRVGHSLRATERASWSRGQESRLLEVRAVELQRMRSSGEIPRWATRRHG